MGVKGKISAAQLYAVFFVSILSSVFTSLSSEAQGSSSANRILNVFPFLIWASLAAVPIFLIIGKNTDQTLMSRCETLSPFLSKTAAALYAAAALWYASLGLSRFGLFMQTELFPNKNVRLLILIFSAAAAYTASKGLETLGRTGLLFFILLAAGILVITGASIKYFDFAELPPLFPTDIKGLFFGGFVTLTKSAEILSLYVLSPCVKNHGKKHYAFWVLCFSLTVCVMFTVIAGVTGAFGERQTFQFYTLTSVAELGVLERLDELLSGLWLLCAFLKTSFFIFLSEKCLRTSFYRTTKKLPFFVLGAAVFLLYLPVSVSEKAYKLAADPLFNGPIFIVLVLIFPTVVYFLSKRKADRRKT